MLLSRMADGGPEIFASVQGEGTTAGVPSVFVRFAECNLVCEFCDTKYTWDWDHHDRAREVIEQPGEAVLARIVELAGETTRNVVITGGEPLLHQDELAWLGAALHERGFAIEVETNGTIEPRDAVAAAVDRWNVSPKLASSGNKLTARLRTGPLTWFATRGWWKLVAITPADLDEIDALVARFGVLRERVLVMPEGTDAETLLQRSQWLVEACRVRGFRFGSRLHVLLWGAERGR
jgi:organic radical activating enzyme